MRDPTPQPPQTRDEELLEAESPRVLSLFDDEARLERVVQEFRLVTARRPSQQEMTVLREALSGYLADYRRDPAAARKFVSQGESARDEKLDVSELAAYSALASLMLNLDETITKE